MNSSISIDPSVGMISPDCRWAARGRAVKNQNLATHSYVLSVLSSSTMISLRLLFFCVHRLRYFAQDTV